ncbi:protein IQ-DOMAIN 14-like isoform X4 [Hibiscus syriacus]|uniref:Protein IQ-DOMAIN 14-like isoform X4 n=1 Tax=Hibiscus syriacus TaxID=106335 RepID=A0A6A3CB18_HIBSY|nr:protein IQ-DOMAIN 14-like [Hibiscus syriacus]KAE8724362.1 protein IQ-DOMAIN 14-like isoform X4 [Hibiscus syriacus]
MAKKNWFSLVKRFFLFETIAKTEKKEKRRKWMFGRSRTKRLTAPTKDEHTVAEEPVSAEIALLTDTLQPEHICDEQSKNVQPDSSSSNEHMKNIQEAAAIEIQATFRGYLTRKALRALKGIVRLQAIIRGTAVRRQAMTTLRCLQSIVNIQSQVFAKRGTRQYDETKQLLTLEDKIIKVDINSQRRWDDSILTKEEADAMALSKKEAAIKRERIKEYSYVHRKSAESEKNKGNGRLKYWLDEWVDTQVGKSKELGDLDSIWNSNRKQPTEGNRAKQLRLKTSPRQDHYNLEGSDSPMLQFPQRSIHKKQSSLGEDHCFSASPVVPTYMAATQSAKAKVRSMSSLKLRPLSFDAQSESYSPYKSKLCLVSSITRTSAYHQRSPSLNGMSGPVKSKQTLTDLRLNSECLLRSWVQESTFR